jgi:hypothetical protein
MTYPLPDEWYDEYFPEPEDYDRDEWDGVLPLLKDDDPRLWKVAEDD